jgi:hypothetical protein
MQNYYLTSDLSKFGARELDILEPLIEAAKKHGLPKDFWDSEVQIMLNTHSGNVFLTNSNCQVAMMNLMYLNMLEIWCYLSHQGSEGFLDDLLDKFDCGEIQVEEFEELAVICENNGKHELAGEIRKKIKENS